ncbi:MAG: HAMP domain-containing histidine kinase [Planctomycetes bacterium]|nr:HAMP domain-containing histidine kinase [Planctomycetota bacterium]
MRQRAYWLVRLRWIAASAVACGTFVSARIFHIPVQEAPLYTIAVLLVLYNAAVLDLLNRFMRVICEQSRRRTKNMIDIQISTDLIILTVLLHFSGGPENPLVLFFIFHVIIASILLSVWESFLQATLAISLFGILLLLEATGVVPHYCLGPQPSSAAFGHSLTALVSHCRYEEKAYLAAKFAAFAVTVYLVVYMAGYIALRLRRAEQAQRRANQMLRQKDRIKDEYVAHLTHDIKGHLAAIQSCLGVAATDSLTGQAAEFVHRAYYRTQKLTAFVRTLLRLTRLKLDGTVETEFFRASDAVQEAVEATQLAAQEKSLHLECDVTPAAATIAGNAISFKEAITNLLLNAIKYTPAGGTIAVRAQPHEDSVIVEITDTGIGIPPEEQPRIFEEFYRASNARQMEPDGDGLGLSLVKRIVELHHGTIGFCSELGHGTTFHMVLPVTIPPEVPAPAMAEASGQPQA